MFHPFLNDKDWSLGVVDFHKAAWHLRHFESCRRSSHKKTVGENLSDFLKLAVQKVTSKIIDAECRLQPLSSL